MHALFEVSRGGKHGWRRFPAEGCLAGGCDIGEDVAMLLLQRGHHGHHRFDNASACRAWGPQAPLAPEDRWPHRPLGGVVRGLHPCGPYERPQGLPPREQLPAGALRCGHPTGLARFQPWLHFAPPGPHRAGKGRLGHRPLADSRPPLAHRPGLPPPGFPHRAGASPARDHGGDVPPQMCPAHLPSPWRVPGVTAPALGHHPPPKRSPQSSGATLPPRDARPTHTVPHAVTAVHSHARGCPARQPVSSK